MDITEKELDEVVERELTDEEYMDLVLLPKEDFCSQKELLLNYKKLVKHAAFCYRLEKEFRMYSVNTDMEIERLQKKLEEKCPKPHTKEISEIDKLSVIKPFYTQYLRDGYSIRMSEGSISAVKDDEYIKLAKTDGNEWRNNPPISVHKVTDKSLIVTVIDEYKDGRIEEIDKYLIIDKN